MTSFRTEAILTPIIWELVLKSGDRPAGAWMPLSLGQVCSCWFSCKFIPVLNQCIGTGGTVAGVGQYLKSKNEDILIAIADPEGSGLYNKVGAGLYIYPQEADNFRR